MSVNSTQPLAGSQPTDTGFPISIDFQEPPGTTAREAEGLGWQFRAPLTLSFMATVSFPSLPSAHAPSTPLHACSRTQGHLCTPLARPEFAFE